MRWGDYPRLLWWAQHIHRFLIIGRERQSSESKGGSVRRIGSPTVVKVTCKDLGELSGNEGGLHPTTRKEMRT